MKKKAMLVFLCLGLSAGAAALAAPLQETREELERKKTSVLLREADGELDAARRAARQGRLTAAEPALERYSRRMEVVNRRMDRDLGPPSPRPDVVRTVERATSRHTRVLEGLLLDAPNPARPGLMRALEASRIGQQRASEKLERMPASQRGPTGVRPGDRRGPPEQIGPPADTGKGAGPRPKERRPRGGRPPL